MAPIDRVAPGLAALMRYKATDAPADLRAGLAVAAVAVPVGIAYAQLAGFRPETGLYATILPLVAYAIFGSSRQLIIGPDAATCAVVAAAVAPLAAGDPASYAALSATLAALAGAMCIAASFLRLGVIADFLSKPILIGFLNGVALSIILGQADKIFGFALHEDRVLPRIIEIAGGLGGTHWPTLAVAAATLATMVILPRITAWLPASLAGMACAGLLVHLFNLSDLGVKTIGAVPGGFPLPTLPSAALTTVPLLLAEAAGLALVSFSSMMLTARAFASKNGYDVDPDQDFAALGAANISSSLLQGFAVSGASSRTAVADAAGGRTHAVGLVAAAAVTLVLMFLTRPLEYVPLAALGVVLVMAGLALIDVGNLRLIYRIDPVEALLSILATLGVLAVGPVNAILFAVILATLRFIKLMSRPRVELLGKVAGFPGLHSLERHQAGQAIPGLLLFRFNAPITFFNAGYFKRELMRAVDDAGPGLRHVVVDMLPVTNIDATGLLTILEAEDALDARGIRLNAAGRATEWGGWAQSRGFEGRRIRLFPTLRQAIRELSGDTGA
ncbi:SulP family inorganic anion transporter [Hyphomicrobium sp.]|uniref:SulP family inorganic anion transporter n=1 Tax=Hyphomicrobium sp. TaxID=82 RepID=UPI002FE144C3